MPDKNNQRFIMEPLRKGAVQSLSKDFYFYFMQGSWKEVIFIIFTGYIALNALFAFLYMLVPYSIAGIEQATFMQAFSFSVQTMSTIGYGALSPGNLYGDLVVTLQAGISIILVAIITGFMFAKASKPKSKILFSQKALIHNFNGEPTLLFRIGNARGNDVVDARVSVTAYINTTTVEGEKFRQLEDINLKRSYSPFFKATWTVMHKFDDLSPIKNNFDQFEGMFVTVVGHDSIYSSTIYARHFYHKENILKDSHFVDIIEQADDGSITINFENFNKIKSV